MVSIGIIMMLIILCWEEALMSDNQTNQKNAFKQTPNKHQISKQAPKKPAENTVRLADIITITDAAFIPKSNINNISIKDIEITGIASLDDAHTQQISFLANAKYAAQLKTTQAFAVLIRKEQLDDCPVHALVVADPYLTFAKISHLFSHKDNHTDTDMTFDGTVSDNISDDVKANNVLGKGVTIGKDAAIGKGVTIGANVYIGKNSHIGNHCQIGANTVIEDFVHIGDDTYIAPNVFIAHHVHIGDHVRIHAQASIGSEGFGFAPDTTKNFRWQRIAQLGSVMIGDDVRIGANTCIDRGALGNTVIEKGVIIDNLVQIAHNVTIGEYTAIAACVGISGSTSIGKYCVLAGGVGVAGHLQIADHVTVTGMTIVTGSIKKSGSYSSGTSTMPTQTWRKAAVNFKKLASSPFKLLNTEIKDLKVRLKRLESRFD